jgi:hypothetical protein
VSLGEDPIAKLGPEDFEALVGQTLPADFGEGHVAARIITVERLPSPSPRAGGAYSVWLGAPVASPSQGNVIIELPVHGQLTLFCCPRRREGHDTVYELVFN